MNLNAGETMAKKLYSLVELMGRNKGLVTQSERMTDEEAERRNQSYGHRALRVFEWVNKQA